MTDPAGLTDTDSATVAINEAAPVEVGGMVYPADKLTMLALWILLAVAMIVGAVAAVKRCRARS